MIKNNFLNAIRYLLRVLRPLVFFKGIIPRILKSLRLVPLSMQGYIFFKGQFTVKTISGNQFYLMNWGHPTYELENKIFWSGLYSIDESTSIKVWEELSMISSTIIDIGANTGIFTLVAKSVNPNANVVAFEPINRIYKKLLKNIHINKYDAAAFEIGISNFDGEQEIYDFPDVKNPYSASLDPHLSNEISSRSKLDLKKTLISTNKLDSLINEIRIKELTNTLIKIDVEQHEPFVLEGMKRMMQELMPIILIEILNNEIGDAVCKFMQNYNYNYFKIIEGKGIKEISLIESSGTHQERNFLLVPKNLEIKSLRKFSIN
jgi:FkbM family methyltransferase